MGLFDFEQQLVFFGQYHTTKINILVHAIIVPLILWTTMVILAGAGPLIDLAADSILMTYGLIPNGALLMAIIYGAYYLLLEPIAGTLYWPVLIFMWKTATSFVIGNPNYLAIALGILSLSWVVQIATHHFIEGRTPALKDNIAQGLLMAPLFMFLEVLFFLGYRASLYKRMQNLVGKEVTKYRQEQAAQKRAARKDN